MTPQEVQSSLTLEWKQGLAPPSVDATGRLNLDPALAGEVANHLQWEQRLPELCANAVEEAQQEAIESVTPSWHWPFWIIPIAGLVGFAIGFHYSGSPR